MVYHRLPAFFLVHGFCSFCKDSDKLRCRDDPWDVVGLSCLGVSPAGDANVSEELKEVARLCMLRDFDSLAFTSDSFVTYKTEGHFYSGTSRRLLEKLVHAILCSYRLESN